MNDSLLAGVCAVFLLAAPALANTDQFQEPPSIIVSGEGTVSVSPTIAMIDVGVVTRDATASKALAANNEAMASLMKTLSGEGIAERDIRTSNFNISAVYHLNGSFPDGGSKITGYTVRNNVTVKVHKVAQTGPLVDAVVASGANQVSRIYFTVEDQSKFLDEARKHAFEDAHRKAVLYAQAAGITLGKVMNVIEGVGHSSPVPMMYAATRMRADEPTPVSAGEQDLRVSTTVVFAIQ